MLSQHRQLVLGELSGNNNPGGSLVRNSRASKLVPFQCRKSELTARFYSGIRSEMPLDTVGKSSNLRPSGMNVETVVANVSSSTRSLCHRGRIHHAGMETHINKYGMSSTLDIHRKVCLPAMVSSPGESVNSREM